MVLSMLFLAISASLAPALVVAQSGDINSLGRVLSRFENLSTFTELLTRYPDVLNAAQTYASVTIVAPSNEAFEKTQDLDLNNRTQVLDVFQYHLLQGEVHLREIDPGAPFVAPTLLTDTTYTNTTGGQRVILNKRNDGLVVFISGADTVSSVLEGDIPYSGGIIHMVDTVLVPPYTFIDMCRARFPEFESFLGALYKVGLAQELNDMNDVTFFAPSDSAFQLTSGALSMITDEELHNVLAYHVVPNRVLFSTDLVDGSVWPSFANGSYVNDTAGAAMLSVTVAANNVYMDSSPILDPDILIANGILHMVAHVMNPAQPDATPDLSLETQEAVFDLTGPTATGIRAPVPFTSNLPCTADCPGTEALGATRSTGHTVISRTSTAGAPRSRPTGMKCPWKAVRRVGKMHWKEDDSM